MEQKNIEKEKTVLSNRCCNILLLLLKSKTSLKLKDIGKEFGISERATRYDLDSIDNFLVKYNFGVLSRKTNVGVRYSVFGEDRKKLFAAILSEREGTVYDTPASRLMAILVNLILSSSHITIDGEADRLMVSRSTVFKDFEKLRTLFNKGEDVLFSSVLGYVLSGAENDLRITAAKVVLSCCEARDIVEIITYSSDEDSLLAGSKMYKIFEGVDEEGLRKTLSLIVEYKGGVVKDNTFAFCAIALCIALKRNALGLCQNCCDCEYPSDVQAIAAPLFGDDICGHAFVAKLVSYLEELETNDSERLSFPDIQLYCHNLINKISKLYDNDLLSSRLIGVVSEEIIDLIFDDLRGKDKLAPVVDMSDNQELYDIIKEELVLYENILKRKINDSDIARFFRIFHSEYQSHKREVERKKVIVLCPFDKTYSGLVSEKIQSLFDVEVRQSSGLQALSADIKKYGCDLIVSTLQVAFSEIHSVKIGTNFGKDELSLLKEYLPNREIGQHVLKSIKDILNKHEVDQSKVVDILKDISTELNISMEEIKQTSDDGTIVAVANCDAANYHEALEKAGEIMVQAGLVLEGYTAEMIDELEKSKTHMVVMDSVVLAHSRSGALVTKTGGVLIKLNSKVPFIDDEDEKCDLIFAISSTGVDSHFKMIAEISEVLSNEEKLKVLKGNHSEEEIFKLFSK